MATLNLGGIKECYAYVYIKNRNGRTELLIATENNYIKIIKYLFEICNANVEEKNYEKRTSLPIASLKGSLKLVKYLVETCHANVGTISEKALTNASEKGNIDIV